MILVNILVIVVLFFSFIGGLKEGAVKTFFSLISLLIAIPLTGVSYHLLAKTLSFLPGGDWENFIGFFIPLALFSLILYFVFLLPRKLLQKTWNKGAFFRLIGGVLRVFNTAIGLVVFTLLIAAYPIFEWLEGAATGSSVLVWLLDQLGFVLAMLPQVFQDASATTVAGLL